MNWFMQDLDSLWLVPLSAVGMYAALLIATRLAGLRSFAKMSSFDFAMTVAVGSLVAATIVSPDPALVRGIVALAVVFLLQMVVGALRVHERGMRSVVDNEPILLMDRTGFHEDHLREARVTRGDIMAQLRKSNVQRLDQVWAVVMETTGDISVLHGEGPPPPLDSACALLVDVRGVSPERTSQGAGFLRARG